MFVLLAAGCASAPSPSTTPAGTKAGTNPGTSERALTDDFGRSRLIVADFVGALQQVPTLAPRTTRLATRAPDSRFSTLLLGALQDAGYELRIGRSTADTLPLAWRIDAGTGVAAVDEWRFELTVGDVTLERRYRADEHGVLPVSAMAVRGARPIAIPDRQVATPVRQPVRQPVQQAVRQPVQGAGRPPIRPPSPPREQPADVAPVNLFETGVSRHASRLSGHAVRQTRVLVFANDSLRLGRENKRIARAMAEDFDAGRDLISVIGCSHGATALKDGNRRLALGRAARVREAFLHAGIAAEQVLDEGCWAGQGHATMPPRGVVVTHHRRVVTG